MGQPKRLGALGKFKSGQRNVLIATDVASRGLDIPSVSFGPLISSSFLYLLKQYLLAVLIESVFFVDASACKCLDRPS